jgi:hypothetical protein
MSELEIHFGKAGDKMADNRAVVTLHADECRQCNEFKTSWAETEAEQGANADAQTAHARETGHRQFWHYQVQRGQSRMMFL